MSPIYEKKELKLGKGPFSCLREKLFLMIYLRQAPLAGYGLLLYLCPQIFNDYGI